MTVFSRNSFLRGYLDALMRGQLSDTGLVDVVVTANEINDRHGTGLLLKRILKGRRSVFAIRSRDHWGRHDLDGWNVRISHEGYSRSRGLRNVRRMMGGRQVGSVLCVPFLIDELLTSIAIKDTLDTPLCAYIMDDQNVASDAIPDDLMREFLEKCSLRFATHPELRLAYEQKYGLPFFILPAVVPESLIVRETLPPVCDGAIRRGALLGSFWDQSWFDRLCSALELCHCQIHWYGNTQSHFLKFPAKDMARAGITSLGVVPEERLAVELRQYPFVIVPAGALDGIERNQGVAELSLPGRILFAAATSQTPILVVGSERTCAARFVKHFDIGETVPYQAAELTAAMDRLSDPAVQKRLRHNAAAIAPAFSDHGIVEWLSASIRDGRPADLRFESVFA